MALRRPEMKVVFISCSSEDLPTRGRAIVPKPFAPAELMVRVGDILYVSFEPMVPVHWRSFGSHGYVGKDTLRVPIPLAEE